MLKIALLSAVLAVTTFGAVGTASAGGGSSAMAPGQNKELLIAFYSSGKFITGSPTPGGVVQNLGGAISGGFYGNTSNAGISPSAPDSGNGVTPALTPGPITMKGTFCSVGGAIKGECGTP